MRRLGLGALGVPAEREAGGGAERAVPTPPQPLSRPAPPPGAEQRKEAGITHTALAHPPRTLRVHRHTSEAHVPNTQTQQLPASQVMEGGFFGVRRFPEHFQNLLPPESWAPMSALRNYMGENSTLFLLNNFRVITVPCVIKINQNSFLKLFLQNCRPVHLTHGTRGG